MVSVRPPWSPNWSEFVPVLSTANFSPLISSIKEESGQFFLLRTSQQEEALQLSCYPGLPRVRAFSSRIAFQNSKMEFVCRFFWRVSLPNSIVDFAWSLQVEENFIRRFCNYRIPKRKFHLQSHLLDKDAEESPEKIIPRSICKHPDLQTERFLERIERFFRHGILKNMRENSGTAL